ncbi:Methyltransferase domain-containing protein [Actinoplanes derwentensis]|uniref:Methyltransferase domain-containing protein n=1 Tax=Actinoplanes derwentensis TaxID=113562 RepID=A0A1H2CYF1_9ACTN|nr:class I SAM-dependent methyltransferase [Actinoplanes derwentensis]GID82932.1 methyltransferase [Actinoplanes derwentensis]SDT75483.1 Methyltransferase domain-containing protein [Actinoplanes derwentensis]
MVTEAEQFWDDHYRSRRTWGGRPNPLLAEVAAPLTPGSALDLGCGPGGDTIWLAQQGWQVTAVDISRTAIEGIRSHATSLGLGGRVTADPHDLGESFPAGTFDLISAQYLHTPIDLDRGRLLRQAARSLRPGGLLLIVDHGSIAPWSWNQDPDTHFPTPTEVAAEIALDPTEWPALRADMPRRQATGPGGQSALVTDNVLLIQRAGAQPSARRVAETQLPGRLHGEAQSSGRLNEETQPSARHRGIV